MFEYKEMFMHYTIYMHTQGENVSRVLDIIIVLTLMHNLTQIRIKC